MFYVYAYSMSQAAREDTWPQLVSKRIESYHECAGDAWQKVTDLINTDGLDPDECWGVGQIPTGACHDHFMY